METNNNEKWKIPCQLKDLDIRNLQITRDEANALLGELNNLSNTVTVRAYTILSFLIPIIAILIAVLFDSIKGKSIDYFLFYNSLISTIIAIVCVLLFVRLLFPHNFYTIGRDPKLLLTTQNLKNPEITGDNTYKLLLSVIITQQQGAITKTRQSLIDRSKLFKIAIRVLIGGFILIALSVIAQAAVIYYQSLPGLCVAGTGS